jgi:uncharacterized protein DUF6968
VDAIAERHLELRFDNRTIDVVVKLGRPVPDGNDCWKCEYEIKFGDATRTTAMHGGDALQALQLSMATLDMELKYGARNRAGVLYHLDEPFTPVLENSGMQVGKPKEQAK